MITPAFVALAAATLAFFVAGGIVLPAAPQFVEGVLGAGRAEVGIAIASFSIAALAMRPVVGWATDRFGRRPVLVVGAVLTILSLLLHVVATSLAVFIVARSLFGAAEAFFFVAALAAASDLAPEGRRGEALSFFSLSLYLGLAFGPLMGETVLTATRSYPAVWLSAAAVTVVALGLTLLTPETMPAREDRLGPRPRARLFHPAGLFPGFLILLGVWGMAGYLAFVPLYVAELQMGGASLPLAVYALVVVGLRLVGARLPDRLGAARLSGSALALSAAGLVIIALVPTSPGLLIGTAIFAAGVAFTFPALLTLAVARVGPDERGMVVGTTSLFLDLAFGLAPVVLGFVADAGGYAAAFLVGAAASALGCAILVIRAPSLATPAAGTTG
jgi:MFS family permease